MKPRKVDLTFGWMQDQQRKFFHYRDEVWAVLAEFRPQEFAVSDDRKTPWFSYRVRLSQLLAAFQGGQV